MKVDPENFENLRKLMALKRFEQPPPGYLHHLPDRIVARIERGEGRMTLWEKVASAFTLRPGVAYAFGLTVCGAVALSVSYTVRRPAVEVAPDSAPGLALSGGVQGNVAVTQTYQDPPFHVANWLGNTNPLNSFSGEPSLFTPTLHTVPASFERR